MGAIRSQKDLFISTAHKLSNNPIRRELDMLLTVDERTTMALLSIALTDLGQERQYDQYLGIWHPAENGAK
jgi:aspartate kinase